MPKRSATSHGAILGYRQKEPPAWRTVIAWQICKLLVEVLEAEIEWQGGSVLLEKKPSLVNLLFGAGSHDLHIPASSMPLSSTESK